jgi:hypothetical protein
MIAVGRFADARRNGGCGRTSVHAQECGTETEYREDEERRPAAERCEKQHLHQHGEARTDEGGRFGRSRRTGPSSAKSPDIEEEE